jgi:hypothetical protein
VTLRCIFARYIERVGDRHSWLRIASNGGLWYLQCWTFGSCCCSVSCNNWQESILLMIWNSSRERVAFLLFSRAVFPLLVTNVLLTCWTFVTFTKQYSFNRRFIEFLLFQGAQSLQTLLLWFVAGFWTFPRPEAKCAAFFRHAGCKIRQFIETSFFFATNVAELGQLMQIF